MALTVYWIQFAEDRLEDIYTYYKFRAGVRIAEALVNGIIDGTVDLNKNPLSGQREEDLSERLQDFRYVVYKNYEIIYWVDEPNQMLLISHIFDFQAKSEKVKSHPLTC